MGLQQIKHPWLFGMVLVGTEDSPGNRSEHPRDSIHFVWGFTRCLCQWVVSMWDRRKEHLLFISYLPIWLCPHYTVGLLAGSRFSGVSLNDGRRGFFSLSISSCSTVYESLVSKVVDKAGDSLRKMGQMRGILCGFCLITKPYLLGNFCSLLTLLSFQESHLIFSLPDILAGALYSVLGQCRHWKT